MSNFLNKRLNSINEYVPGEQPKEIKYIKLNTNESPYKPSDNVIQSVAAAANKCNLYSDTSCQKLREAAAKVWKVKKENVACFNGSDEALSFAFYAYGERGVCYPEISYGFYSVFCDFYNLNKEPIPLKTDLYVDYQKFFNKNKLVVIANPNAPTGLSLSKNEIEEIIKSNLNSVVVVDEAYVEFGGDSVIDLVDKYENLLVTRTFSKSHSLAGARLGFAVGNEKLINDLNKLRFSFNPYNVNLMTESAGVAAFESESYYKDNCKKIIKTRETVIDSLKAMGFTVTDSKANFIFAKPKGISGKELFIKLRENGILVRRFDIEKISDFLRISIGSESEMQTLISVIKKILEK